MSDLKRAKDYPAMLYIIWLRRQGRFDGSGYYRGHDTGTRW